MKCGSGINNVFTMETKHIWAGLGEEERVQLLEMSWDLNQGSAVMESPDSAIP